MNAKLGDVGSAIRFGWVLALAAFLAIPAAVGASSGTPTAISMGAPSTLTLGQTATLQARLVDGSGAPVAKATIYFTAALSFLNVDGNVVVAQAVTNKDGLAAASWQVRSTGNLTVKAEFRGDDRYAPSSTSAHLVVTGDQQLYVDQPAVVMPGFNAAPFPFLAGLWPRLTPWPIALVLLIVWSLYGRVALLLRQIVAAAEHPAIASEPEVRP